MSLSTPRGPYLFRAAAVLPATPVWDAAPVAFRVSYGMSVELYFDYTRGGALGAFRWRIETSPDLAAGTWYQTSIYEAGIVAPGGADVMSRVQREEFEYFATGAAAETFVFGPIRVEDGVARIRFPATEWGNPGAPGNLEIRAMLSSEK